LLSVLIAGLLFLAAVPAASGMGVPRGGGRGRAVPPGSGPIVTPFVKHDVSPPLRTLKGAHAKGGHHVIPLHHAPPLPRGKANGLRTPAQPRVAPHIPSPSNSFDGVGDGFTGPQGTYSVNIAPPDTNGAVGPQDYVQIVNTDFAVFNKDPSRGTVGNVRYGPVAINTLWTGFGGLCEADNDGDPVVVYDGIANRWVISQLAVTNPDPNYYQCVAISTGSDPTGSYYRYAAAYSDFNDYPKMAVWPDAYYETYNLFDSTNTFVGAEACAFDRTHMLIGAAASQVCFTSNNDASWLPSTLDGPRLPPTGSPNYLLDLNTTTSLNFWKFHVDFATPSNSTFTGPTNIPVTSFTGACSSSGFTCIPQSGTTQQLDSLGDRLMYRLAYRNFGSYESLVVDHAVKVGSSVGMRWYEIRSPGGTPTVYQQGTYAPDSNYRWMGSIAEDRLGDMAMGFSISSSTTHPGISYTGRLAGDALGTMPQGEASVIVGAGSQTFNLNRWGDYSAMAVDPTDDCTFWYTNEYIPSNGTFNWKTRIASFKFPGCPGTQLIQNGGFESGTANWTEYSADGQQTIHASAQAHSGTQAFFPCGYADCDDRVSQTITVPATVNSAALSFWLSAFSSLGATSPSAPCVDHLYATLATPDGTVISGGTIAPLCETVADSGYLFESFNVTGLLQGHTGQPLIVMLRGTTANEAGALGSFTHWGVDDVSLLLS
jgi:hypothetical protein